MQNEKKQLFINNRNLNSKENNCFNIPSIGKNRHVNFDNQLIKEEDECCEDDNNIENFISPKLVLKKDKLEVTDKIKKSEMKNILKSNNKDNKILYDNQYENVLTLSPKNIQKNNIFPNVNFVRKARVVDQMSHLNINNDSNNIYNYLNKNNNNFDKKEDYQNKLEINDNINENNNINNNLNKNKINIISKLFGKNKKLKNSSFVKNILKEKLPEDNIISNEKLDSEQLKNNKIKTETNNIINNDSQNISIIIHKNNYLFNKLILEKLDNPEAYILDLINYKEHNYLDISEHKNTNDKDTSCKSTVDNNKKLQAYNSLLKSELIEEGKRMFLIELEIENLEIVRNNILKIYSLKLLNTNIIETFKIRANYIQEYRKIYFKYEEARKNLIDEFNNIILNTKKLSNTFWKKVLINSNFFKYNSTDLEVLSYLSKIYLINSWDLIDENNYKIKSNNLLKLNAFNQYTNKNITTKSNLKKKIKFRAGTNIIKKYSYKNSNYNSFKFLDSVNRNNSVFDRSTENKELTIREKNTNISEYLETLQINKRVNFSKNNNIYTDDKYSNKNYSFLNSESSKTNINDFFTSDKLINDKKEENTNLFDFNNSDSNDNSTDSKNNCLLENNKRKSSQNIYSNYNKTNKTQDISKKTDNNINLNKNELNTNTINLNKNTSILSKNKSNLKNLVNINTDKIFNTKNFETEGMPNCINKESSLLDFNKTNNIDNTNFNNVKYSNNEIFKFEKLKENINVNINTKNLETKEINLNNFGFTDFINFDSVKLVFEFTENPFFKNKTFDKIYFYLKTKKKYTYKCKTFSINWKNQPNVVSVKQSNNITKYLLINSMFEIFENNWADPHEPEFFIDYLFNNCLSIFLDFNKIKTDFGSCLLPEFNMLYINNVDVENNQNN